MAPARWISWNSVGFSKIVFTTAGGGRIQFKTNSGANLDFVTSGFSVLSVVRLGDISNHGGTMVTATGLPLKPDGIAACKNGDSHACPITGPGTTPVLATTVSLRAGTDLAVN